MLTVQDLRVLHSDSLFVMMDAKRKTAQHKKDFINDQDSTSGPGVIDNMIRNILTIRAGTLSTDLGFGVKLDDVLFEQLDWANLEFIRTTLFNSLSRQLPANITVTHIDLKTPKERNMLNIDIAYNIKMSSDENAPLWKEPGPKTIGERKAYVSLNV